MKKIVALVLAMVMVMGLATVAFADTKDFDVKDVKIVSKAGEVVTYAAGTTKVVMTTENKVTENGKFASLTPAYYSVDGKDYVVCDESIATHLLTVAGAKVYAVEMTPTAVTVDGAKLYTAPEKEMCDKVGDEENVFVVVEGKYYALGGNALALVNGKMVSYDDSQEFLPKTHEVKNDSEKYATNGAIASFVCDVCGKTVNVIPADKKPAFATNYSEPMTMVDGKQYIYVIGSGAVDAADEKVESAETFDAGIAMYVGMSVMAAAGSAVVLKKKD